MVSCLTRVDDSEPGIVERAKADVYDNSFFTSWMMKSTVIEVWSVFSAHLASSFAIDHPIISHLVSDPCGNIRAYASAISRSSIQFMRSSYASSSSAGISGRRFIWNLTQNSIYIALFARVECWCSIWNRCTRQCMIQVSSICIASPCKSR
jgi:hypothetical protein